MAESKLSKAGGKGLAEVGRLLASQLTKPAIRASVEGLRLIAKLEAGHETVTALERAGAMIHWAHRVPGGRGHADRLLFSGSLLDFDFIGSESGPADSREVEIEVFAAGNQGDHGKRWQAKLAVLDDLLHDADEIGAFVGHLLASRKGKARSTLTAVILRALSESIDS